MYLPLTVYGIIYNYITNHTGILKAFAGLIRGYLLLGEQFCSWPLWYLLSSIYGLLILMWFVKSKKIDNIPFLLVSATAIYFVAVLLNWINTTDIRGGELETVKMVVDKTIMGGRLFSGIRYFLLGIAFHKIEMKRTTLWRGLIIAAIVMICLTLCFHLNYSNTALSPMIVVPFLVKLFMCYKKRECRKFRLYRQFSQIAYYTHMFFLFIFWYDLTGFKKIREEGLSSFLFAFAGVILIFFLYMIINGFKVLSKNKREENEL